MIRRPRRTAPATVVALVLFAVCAGVAVAIVQSLLGGTPFLGLEQLLGVTAAQRWNSATMIAVAVVVAVVGLLLFAVAVRPGRPVVLPLAVLETPDGGPGADAGVRRATLAKDLAAAVATVPGVSAVNVDASRGAVTARVRTAGTGASGVPDAVHERLTARLADIAPARMPRVRVRVQRDGGA